jgi:uncharacterized damage-inducible protein DinB
MNWTELLNAEIQFSYETTERLLALVDPNSLQWKPATGSNWMTMGQLIMHLTGACRHMFKGFVTGDWGLPPGVDMSKLKPEDMLLPAEELPSLASVPEAIRLVQDDKRLTLQMLAACSEDRLARDKAPAPWDPPELLLGHRLLLVVDHLKQHKGQLFYYLKLQGKSVNTGNLWGIY